VNDLNLNHRTPSHGLKKRALRRGDPGGRKKVSPHLKRARFMARPRVFISSTFYDLKQVRSALEIFIKNIGYDPVLHERGAVPLWKQRET
jgi:hypothetical protein